DRAVDVPAGERIEPGGEACYQEWRYWYLLGEFITRITGRPGTRRGPIRPAAAARPGQRDRPQSGAASPERPAARLARRRQHLRLDPRGRRVPGGATRRPRLPAGRGV